MCGRGSLSDASKSPVSVGFKTYIPFKNKHLTITEKIQSTEVKKIDKTSFSNQLLLGNDYVNDLLI